MNNCVKNSTVNYEQNTKFKKMIEESKSSNLIARRVGGGFNESQ